MVTGEQDGTQRITSIVQFLPENLKALMHGSGGISTDADEGTESQASEWTEELRSDDFELVYTLTDDNPGSVKGGSEAFEIERTGSDPGHLNKNKIVRILTTPFTWGNFQYMTLWIYAESTVTNWTDTYIGFRNADGEVVYVNVFIDNSFEGIWKQVTLNKGDMLNPSSWGSDEVITEQFIRPQSDNAHIGKSLYFDAFDIVRFGGSPVAVSVDASGNIQMELLTATTITDILITIDTVLDNIKAKTDNLISNPAVESKQMQQDSYWLTQLNMSGLLKAEEDGKIVVCTDIIAVNLDPANAIDFDLRQGGTAGIRLFLIRIPAVGALHFSFRQGSEGVSYDGSGAGNLYMNATGSGTARHTAIGYMRDA